MTHYLRSRHVGILVGIGTAKADNPGLNTRYSEDGKEIVGMERQPRPLVLDPSGRWNVYDTPKLFALAEKGEGKAPWWVVCSGGDGEMADKVEKSGGLRLDGGVYKGRHEGVDWDVIMREMTKNGITSVMIEGGGSVRGLLPQFLLHTRENRINWNKRYESLRWRGNRTKQP
jgi:2,5-diamino-6-(ribosylamino)-4(3H)-pyrimidinone 5'-phosphate reductase